MKQFETIFDKEKLENVSRRKSVIVVSKNDEKDD